MARRLAPCVNRRDVRDLYLVVSAIPHTRFAGEPKEFYVRTEDELSIAERGRQATAGRNRSALFWVHVQRLRLARFRLEFLGAPRATCATCPCSKTYRISGSVHPQTIEPAGDDLGRSTGPMCASGRISLTQPRPTDCGNSSRATFVAIMQAADLRKCDDLASRRRLDATGVRTIFVQRQMRSPLVIIAKITVGGSH